MNFSWSAETFSRGKILRKPPDSGNGYWAGAPGVFHDGANGDWYLSYRLRRPRGVHPDRGGETRIASSQDLVDWRDIKSMEKQAFASSSIERCALQKTPGGNWLYFSSYVDPADGHWCVAQISAPQVSGLLTENQEVLFRGRDLSLEGVKDPWIFSFRNEFYMFLSVATSTPRTSAQSHASQDIFNTGECISATGLAISRNLRDWTWKGLVLTPEGNGWDRYCRRLNTILPWKQKFIGFYDGSASHDENYEEKTGLAISDDLLNWKVLTPEGPCLTSIEGTGSLRYLEAKVAGPNIQVFYEYSLNDRSHDLRHLTLRLEDWEKESFEN